MTTVGTEGERRSGIGTLRRTLERVRPRDLTSLAGDERSRERDRRIALTAVSSAAATGIGAVVSLITIPLTVRYLGTQGYGLWVTIASATALLSFADLGLSSGLVNAISETQATHDVRAARRFVASAFYLLVLIAGAIALGVGLLFPHVDWAGVFNVDSTSVASVAGPAFLVFVAVTLVGVPVGIAPRIRSGYQEGYANGAWQAVGSIASLVAVVVAILAGATLPWLVLALGAGPLVASVLNGGALLRRRPWLTPRVRDVTRRAGGTILRLGLLFFIVQIAGIAAVETDNLVIARILGVTSVTQYAVPMKLFLFVPLVSNLVVTPLWPAYREALTRRDVPWVMRSLRRSILGATAWGVVASAALVLVGRPLIEAWAGSDVSPTTPLLIALGLLSVLFCVGNTLAVYMNAANVIGFQAVCLSVMVVVNLTLSIVLTRSIGISGPAWGSAISLGLVVIVPYALYVRASTRRLRASES